MNKTFEKAFNELPPEEREAIVSGVTELRCLGETGLFDDALIKLFILLRERKEGDLNGLSQFEEKVMEKAVIAGNTLLEPDNFR